MAATKSAPMYTDLDAIDLQIISALKEDGRASNQRIARDLELSPAAVSARIRRLERDRMLKMVLVSDFDVLGCDLLLSVGVKVNHRDARAVAEDLAALPEVFSCNLMVGLYNVEALVALRDAAALKKFIEQDIAQIDGIHEISVEVAVDMLKYEFDIVPFTA